MFKYKGEHGGRHGSKRYNQGNPINVQSQFDIARGHVNKGDRLKLLAKESIVDDNISNAAILLKQACDNYEKALTIAEKYKCDSGFKRTLATYRTTYDECLAEYDELLKS